MITLEANVMSGPAESRPALMKAVAVIPGKPGSVHQASLARPSLERLHDGRNALVQILQVGVDGTDREIIAAEYGAAPPGDEFLILGHESLGRVAAVEGGVEGIRPGDLVVATVRRPGTSLYDTIGEPDMTTDDTYRERGINLLHGFLTEEYVEEARFLVKVPEALGDVGVLTEPFSVVEKGVTQAYEVERRLKVWRPRRAAVLGSGTVGLLATLALRLRGLDTVTFGRARKPYLNADLIEALGGRYESTEDVSVLEGARKHGAFDLIFEATGYSPIIFEAQRALARNGVLVLASVTGGNREVTVPSDRINLDFVLGNKAMVGTVNASREHFEMAVRDMAQSRVAYPGWLERLITHRVRGLDRFEELFASLSAPGAIKVVSEVG